MGLALLGRGPQAACRRRWDLSGWQFQWTIGAVAVDGGAVAGAQLAAALRLGWFAASGLAECVLLSRRHGIVLVELLEHFLICPALQLIESPSNRATPPTCEWSLPATS